MKEESKVEGKTRKAMRKSNGLERMKRGLRKTEKWKKEKESRK